MWIGTRAGPPRGVSRYSAGNRSSALVAWSVGEHSTCATPRPAGCPERGEEARIAEHLSHDEGCGAGHPVEQPGQHDFTGRLRHIPALPHVRLAREDGRKMLHGPVQVRRLEPQSREVRDRLVGKRHVALSVRDQRDVTV